ncbi:MAG TPA: phage tail protein [Pyrinomonadaceae bacterium]|nr:phage tail protein [Pyrinomonadaceae bacterium]
MRRDKDPYGNYRFKLQLGNVEVAGFAECTGLGMETKVFEYKEGGNNSTTLKFAEATTYSNVVLKRGITKANDLINWHMEVVNGTFGTNKRDGGANIAILLMDDKGDEVKRWSLIRALPVKWTGPEFKATGNEIAIETLELTHEGIQT